MLPAIRDLRYLLAYTVPATAFLGLRLGGPWVWLTLGYTFGLVPLLEWLVRPTPGTPEVAAATEARRHPFFDGLLYLNVPLLLALLGYFLARVAAAFSERPKPPGRCWPWASASGRWASTSPTSSGTAPAPPSSAWPRCCC